MAGDGVDDPSFTSPSSALTHYRTLCTSLQSQLQSAEDDLRDLRELQDELERELERFEEGERGMRGEVEGLREEREEWKSKYLLALSSHSSTITHMQKELESLRLTERGLRNKLREVEVDNDDLEGRERATSSSLADLEARYNKSLERIALLEEELVGKARLEEEVQRARDELRDLNEELAITKSQLDTATARLASQHTDSNATPTKPPPRRRTPSPPASPQTPTIEFVQPTPVSSRTTPTTSASPSKLPRPLSFSSSSGSGSLANLPPAPLSRSTRLSHLPSLSSSPTTTASPSKLPQSTAARLTRSDTASMIREMQAMTGRVRRLTERLDQGRGPAPRRGGGRGSPSLGNLSARAAGGGMGGGGGGMTRSSTMRLPATTASRPSSRLDSHPPPQTQSTRPPSRSALRASIGSSIRPPSRLSVSSTSTSTSGTSRAASPTPGVRPSSRLGGLGRSVGPGGGGGGGNPPVAGLASSIRAGATHVRRQSSTSSSTSGRSTPSEDPLRRSTASGLGLGRPSSALGQSQGPGGARRASGGFGLLGRRVSLANGRREREREEVPPVPRLPGR